MRTRRTTKQVMEPRYLSRGDGLVRCQINKVHEEIMDPNLSYVLEYHEKLKILAKDEKTQGRILRELRFVMNALGKMDAKQAAAKDIDRVVSAIIDSELAAISKRKHLLTLRVFWSWLYGNPIDSHEYYPLVKNIKYTITNLRKEISKSAKSAADIPTLEEIKKMVEVAEGPEAQLEKTVVMLLASTGMRCGELVNIKMADLQLENDPTKLSHLKLCGKTGVRVVGLMREVLPFLKNYVETERKSAKFEEPLFIYKGHALDFDNVRFILKKLAEKAGIKRRITSHLFRYYLSSYFASVGKQESQMAMFFGYSPNMARHYTKLASADSILQEGENKPNRKILEEKTCSKCRTVASFMDKLCPSCMKELDDNPYQEIQQMKKELELLKTESRLYRKAFDTLGKHEDLADKIQKILKEES